LRRTEDRIKFALGWNVGVPGVHHEGHATLGKKDAHRARALSAQRTIDERNGAAGYFGEPQPKLRCWPAPELGFEGDVEGRDQSQASQSAAASGSLNLPRSRCNRVHDVLVPEVVLESPHVPAIIGELVATGMPEHVRIDGELELGTHSEARFLADMNG